MKLLTNLKELSNVLYDNDSMISSEKMMREIIKELKNNLSNAYKLIDKLDEEGYFDDEINNRFIYDLRAETDLYQVGDVINLLDALSLQIEDEDARRCSDCGAAMYKGYCIDDGEEYYCGNECLFKHYTVDEWNELYDNERGYWTEWND